MTARTTTLGALVLVACSCGGAAPATTSTPADDDEPARASFHVELGVPGDPLRWVMATLDDEPLEVTGCVMPERGPCEESMRVVLDDDAREELQALLDDVAATPRCEPEGIHEGDREYTLRVEGGARYSGHVPADGSQMTARNGGPCRADARLAWWIARWLVGAARPASEQPSSVIVTLDATSASGPRFVNATIDLGSGPWAIVGCTASVAGACIATQRVVLDDAGRAHLGALLEDVRSEPCHAPFPAGAGLSIATGLVYDGPCGADAELAWWAATRLDPSALTPGPS